MAGFVTLAPWQDGGWSLRFQLASLEVVRKGYSNSAGLFADTALGVDAAEVPSALGVV